MNPQEANDNTSVILWNWYAINFVLDDDTTSQVVFCVICNNSQAFLFVEVCSSCMVASSARCFQHFCSYSRIICGHTAHRSTKLRRFPEKIGEKMQMVKSLITSSKSGFEQKLYTVQNAQNWSTAKCQFKFKLA